ncbi:MAG TPA: type II toxin-antitoxin system RelE/ParE family toxin [Verrucomicrobiae bacterium]|nr:type II toxin-antitoxin system RelE/ParE family toxin [Verrucomicrobiae bacterium]
MSRTTRFARAARIDYRDAVEWYENKQAGLGERFGIAISSAIERIIYEPELFRATSYRMSGHAVRRLIVTRFPFVIYFCATSEEVVIVAIFHSSRDPRQILERGED